MNLKIAMVTIMVSITGCTKVSYTPQAAIGIAITESEVALLVKEEIQTKSESIGFTEKSSVGNTEHFAKTNQFQETLRMKDGKSFIMVGNLIDVRCIRLSVYSENSEEDAHRVVARLTEVLQSVAGINLQITDNPNCKNV